jgi:hypothetical protein
VTGIGRKGLAFVCAALVICGLIVASVSAQSAGYSLRFYGNGTGDIDRVKIPVDPPTSADISGSFTIEFFIRVNAGENRSGACTTGEAGWTNGNIILDRDIFGSGDNGDYGISLFGQSGVIAFGVTRNTSGDTICGTRNVVDGKWHHIAVTRNTSTGALALYVDGVLDGTANGPTGDISYRNNRATSWPNDPFLVIGAEKHDYSRDYPSYSGWFDELRISTNIRYTAAFTPPKQPFVKDTNTALLYHFDEGTGEQITDSSGNGTNGVRRPGGNPAGPEWSTEIPFATLPPTATPTVTPSPTATASSTPTPLPPTATTTPSATPTVTLSPTQTIPPPTATPSPTLEPTDQPTLGPSPIPVGPRLTVRVAPETAASGAVVTVTLRLEGVQDVYGLQAECQVNPAVLSGTSRMDGEVFFGSDSFYVDGGYQTDGHWRVAVSRLNPAPAFTGDGTAFSLNYTVIGAGESAVTCGALAANSDGQKLELTVSDAAFYADDAAAETPTAEPTVEPTSAPPTPTQTPTTPPPTPTETLIPVIETPIASPGLVSGVVAYQNGGDAAGITVMLISGQLVIGGVVTTADGTYTFTGIAPGEYLLLADAPGYLAVAQRVQVVADQGTSAPIMVLLAGDTDDNQVIDLADAGFIGANFGLDAGVAPSNADLNTDGAVNIVDLTLVGGNFGKSGPVMQP